MAETGAGACGHSASIPEAHPPNQGFKFCFTTKINSQERGIKQEFILFALWKRIIKHELVTCVISSAVLHIKPQDRFSAVPPAPGSRGWAQFLGGPVHGVQSCKAQYGNHSRSCAVSFLLNGSKCTATRTAIQVWNCWAARDQTHKITHWGIPPDTKRLIQSLLHSFAIFSLSFSEALWMPGTGPRTEASGYQDCSALPNREDGLMPW